MYRLYTDLCESKGLEKVSQDKYRKIFDYDFNFGFHRPKKDQCEVCIAYQHRKDQATAEEKKDYSTHMNNKITARHIKDNAEKDACQSSTTTGCAFDLQQILLCPHGKSSSFFYKRRLGVYCFMWPESEGRRGSCEVATCLFKYIEMQSHRKISLCFQMIVLP